MESLDSQLVKTMLYLERYQGDSLSIIQENLATAQNNIINYIKGESNQAKINKYIKSEMDSAFSGLDESVIEDIEHITGTTWDSMGAMMAKGFVTSTLADAFKDFNDVPQSVRNKLLSKNKLIQGHKLDDHFKHLSATNARKLQGIIVD